MRVVYTGLSMSEELQAKVQPLQYTERRSVQRHVGGDGPDGVVPWKVHKGP